MRKRRKRLFVRQSLAYREGKSHDSSWGIGYWDNNRNVHADQAFRQITSRPSAEEAAKAAAEIAQRQRHLYVWDAK